MPQYNMSRKNTQTHNPKLKIPNGILTSHFLNCLCTKSTARKIIIPLAGMLMLKIVAEAAKSSIVAITYELLITPAVIVFSSGSIGKIPNRIALTTIYFSPASSLLMAFTTSSKLLVVASKCCPFIFKKYFGWLALLYNFSPIV